MVFKDFFFISERDVFSEDMHSMVFDALKTTKLPTRTNCLPKWRCCSGRKTAKPKFDKKKKNPKMGEAGAAVFVLECIEEVGKEVWREISCVCRVHLSGGCCGR